MCEFFLKGQCFHPKRVEQGKIAQDCEVHDCNHCTSSTWQKQKIKENYARYQEIISMTTGKQFSTEENQAEKITRIFD